VSASRAHVGVGRMGAAHVHVGVGDHGGGHHPGHLAGAAGFGPAAVFVRIKMGIWKLTGLGDETKVQSTAGWNVSSLICASNDGL